MSDHYFGKLRLPRGRSRLHVEVTNEDGTVSTRTIKGRENPIESRGPGITFNGQKLTTRMANELYERDTKEGVWMSDNVG